MTALNRQIKAGRQHLNILSASPALISADGYVRQRRKSLELLQSRLVSAQSRKLEVNKRRYVSAVAKLDALSPLKVLTRGYALTKTENGDLLKSVNQVSIGDRIEVNVSDGKLKACVLDKEES